MVGKGLDRKVQRVFLAVVPVANLIEVEEAAIVACDLTHLPISLLDLSPHVVLPPEHVRPVLNHSCQVVSVVTESLLGNDLVAKGTHEKPVDLIIWLVESHAATVWKLNFALTNVLHLGGLQAGTDDPLHRAAYLVIFVLDTHVRDWGMV